MFLPATYFLGSAMVAMGECIEEGAALFETYIHITQLASFPGLHQAFVACSMKSGSGKPGSEASLGSILAISTSSLWFIGRA